MSVKAFVLALTFGASMVAQTLPPVTGVNYGPIEPRIRVAPGQVAPLALAGVRLLPGDNYQTLVAPTGSALPFTLGGVTVSVSKGDFEDSSRVFEPVPIFKIEQWPYLCGLSPPYAESCFFSLVTVHLPFDLLPEPRIPGVVVSRPTLMVMKVGDRETARLRLYVDVNRPHIVRSCDVGDRREETCAADFITSAEGKLLRTGFQLSGVEPSPGEVVVAYAYGLGRTDPIPIAGEPVRRPTPLAYSLPIYLEWLAPNGGIIERQEVKPEYAGLTPGTIGLYQVNVAIPSVPAGVEMCSSVRGRFNLRVSIPGPAGIREAAEICVKSN